jgi:hypothetical protein
MSKHSHMTPKLVVASLALAAGLAGCGGVGTAQADLRSAIDARQSTLNECYREALTRDETLDGDLSLRVSLAKSETTISGLEVTHSNIDDAELVSCIEQALAGLSIDEAPKSALTVDYTMQFTASDAR